MIKHVLMWKLKEHAEGKSKAENINVAIQALDILKAKIPVILRLEVGKNFAVVDNAYDLVITVEFANRDDFMHFLDHPAHTQLGEEARHYKEQTIVVDYEV